MPSIIPFYSTRLVFQVDILQTKRFSKDKHKVLQRITEKSKDKLSVVLQNESIGFFYCQYIVVYF